MSAWIRNEAQFLGRIRRRMKLLGYLRKPMEKVLAYQEDSVVRGTIVKQRTIKSDGSRKFKKLSERYASKKARLFPGAPILVATGKMLSAESFTTWLSSMAGKTIGKLIYKGPKRGLVHMDPLKKTNFARRWYGFRTGDARQIKRIITAGIANIMRRLRYE